MNIMRICLFAFIVFLAIPLQLEAHATDGPRPEGLTSLASSIVLLQDNRPRGTSDADLKQLTKGWTEKRKADLYKLMEGLDPTTRAKLIEEMLRERREALTIETVLVRWRPGYQHLVIADDILSRYLRGGLRRSDIQALRDLKLKGTLEIVGRGTDGSAPKRVRVVVIMQHQLDQPFHFSVPTAGTVVCLQLESGWRLLPINYPMSKKIIELVKTSERTTSIVKNDAGGISSSTAFTWD
jgi:hypothetical protein